MFLIRSIIFGITFVALVKLSSCGIGRFPSPIHPDHPDKCYWKDTETLLSVGSRYRVPGQCSEAVCEAAGVSHYEGLSFKVTTCGLYGLNDPNCREIEPNIRLPFPRCCLKYECTDSEGRITLT